MFKKILIGIVVLVVLGGVVSAMGDDEKATAPVSTSAPADQPKAPPMVITADKLVEDLKGNALNASESYKGKYVEVTGQLSNIDSAGKYFSIAPMNNDFSLTNIMCKITEDQKAIVSKFTAKQKLTVTGTITDVGEVMGYTMKVESIK